MQFRTETEPLRGHQGMIAHGSPVWTIGSCFADNIGRRLADDLFEVRANPFGPLFNPASIELLLTRLACGQEVAPAEFFEHEGLWRSFEFHSRVCGKSATEAAENANRLIRSMHDELPRLRCLAITLGSSFTFTHNPSSRVVANCHKQPASLFRLDAMSPEETFSAISRALEALRIVNPGLEVIVTVSPVRHAAYGQRRDKLSKASLLLATQMLEEAGAAVYFPAYEIMMDDLRDYRFYAPDMAHPSDQAADYIYEIFARSFFSTETEAIAAEAGKLARLAAHRPADPGRHAKAVAEAREKLLAKYPQLKTAIINNANC